jgi:hypothetical protein
VGIAAPRCVGPEIRRRDRARAPGAPP